ncbi:MAG: hypothetical protein ACQEQ4_09235 [Fibrobacterota bacterium]
MTSTFKQALKKTPPLNEEQVFTAAYSAYIRSGIPIVSRLLWAAGLLLLMGGTVFVSTSLRRNSPEISGDEIRIAEEISDIQNYFHEEEEEFFADVF